MSENGEMKIIEIPIGITVRDLSERLRVSPIDVIKTLMASGVMANINQQIDFDTAAIVAAELGFEAKPETIAEETDEDIGKIPLWRQLLAKEDSAKLKSCPPVIGILGHVDHGKTTLLDAIRETNVAGDEAGGITQRIGAYQVEHNGRQITFIDTPGHAAFTAMRARGAQGANIVVLVVAADDGVMPQTREAIAHAQAAQVPIIVAINKIDKPNAIPEQVKQQLAEVELIPDEWDGDTIVVPISAKEKQGLVDLLEAILLVAEDMNILANPEGDVFGTVIDASHERGRGVVATLLVQNGTLEVGDAIVAGQSCGRIKAMFNHQGKRIQKVSPSNPASIMGLDEIPTAGELFRVVESRKIAREIVREREIAEEEEQIFDRKEITLEQLFARIQAGEAKELPLIVKADVQGSLEPIVSSLEDLEVEDIGINVLYADIGKISENDVMLASSSEAIIIGFNVSADVPARRMAEKEKVSIRSYTIIYRLIEDVEKALKGLLEPEEQEVVIGRAGVLAVFPSSKFGKVAGCRVVEGEFRRNARVRIVRDKKEIFKGNIASLKRHQDNVREVRAGFECGIGMKGFDDFEKGDILECFIIEMVAIQ
ncbi:MAG: translation initiation factor IF-2 [Chloroflexota bacterium]|nr:translation initiation factor IF-2 [Chloroflexota bacterium]